MTVVSGTMLILGFGFVFAGVIGILRLPDFYCRLHAMGKCDTLGVALMLGGLALPEGARLTSFKICSCCCSYHWPIQLPPTL